MEDLIMDNQNTKIPIITTKIISKYKNINDRLNFCLKKIGITPGRWGLMPFFLQSNYGRKKYLPNNFSVNYKLHFFLKGRNSINHT